MIKSSRPAFILPFDKVVAVKTCKRNDTYRAVYVSIWTEPSTAKIMAISAAV